MGSDLAAGADRATAAAAIAALSPAIELADVDLPPEDVEAILNGNIFQRHVVLGPRDASARRRQHVAASPAASFGAASRRRAPTDPEAATGKLIDIVRHVADLLAAFGERLRAGDVIITGSIVPPLFIEPDERRLDIRARSDRLRFGAVLAIVSRGVANGLSRPVGDGS